MEIKIDFKDSMTKSVGVMKLGAFWRGMAFPDNIGPALSFMIVVGLAPAAAILLQWIVIFPIRLGVFSFQLIIYSLIQAVLIYAFFVIMPPVMGAILAALDPALNVNKGSAPAYATVVAYSLAPAAIGVCLSSILAFMPAINVIGWLISLALGVLSLAALYFGLTEGLGIDSSNAIVLLLITLVVIAIVYALVIYMLLGSLFGGMIGSLFYSRF